MTGCWLATGVSHCHRRSARQSRRTARTGGGWSEPATTVQPAIPPATTTVTALCCHFATFFWCTHLDPAATCVQVGAHFAPTLRPAPAPPALPPSDGHFSYYPNASLTTDPTAPFDAPTIDRHLRAHNPPRPCRRQLELRNVTRCNGSTHSDESLFGSNPLESNCCPAPSRLVQSWQPVILHREIERPLKKMRLATLVPAFLFFPLAMSQTSSVALTDLLDNVGDAEVPVGIRAVIGPGTTVIPGQSS